MTDKTDKEEKTETIVVDHEEKRRLPITLTPEELAEMRVDLARCVTEKGDLEDQKSDVVKEFNGKIHVLESDISHIVRDLRAGERWEEVACEVQHNYAESVVLVVRMDNRLVIERRPLTDAERQSDAFRTGVGDESDQETES